MNQMEEALYRAGAHIVFKTVRPDPPETLPPLNRMKVPGAPGVRKAAKLRQQRIVGGIPRDPVDKSAALVTSKTPQGCEPPTSSHNDEMRDR
jgi:hypothetical protein